MVLSMTADQTVSSQPGSERFWQMLKLGLGLVLFLILLLMPTPSGMTVEAQRLLAITALMASYWIMEPIPIPVTSLIPLALYPLFNILPAGKVSRAYGDPVIYLFLGGFLLALGIERWNLHRRIALHVLSRVGSSPRRMIFGFMLATGLLSMWISNTATTLMMLPIGLALMSTLHESLKQTSPENADETIRTLTIPVLLSIAYAASASGVSTYVGTPTNMVFRGYWQQEFVSQGYPDVTFAEWMLVFIPMSAAMLVIVGIVMSWGLKPLPNADQLTSKFFRNQLQELGKMSSAEWKAGLLFALTALLWVFRESVIYDGRTIIIGWPDLLIWIAAQAGTDLSYLSKTVSDSTIAIFMAALLFVLPGNRTAHERPRLLTWKEAERGVPWGMLLLFGGGFAMADAFGTTQLSGWLGENFQGWIAGYSQLAVTMIVCTWVTVMTEFTSNTATANMLMPILSAVAQQLQMDPRLLLIPATISSSYGFMMPVGTPPNAIVIGTGKVPVRAMLAYGFILNVLGIFCVSLFTWYIGAAVMRIPLPGGG